MTDQTLPERPACPGCGHIAHHPGTECEAGVEHGPKHWHACLCLNLVGAETACHPQMTCQGGKLGYSDAWHIQRRSGLRGLLEHVGIDTTGRDITVDGKTVNAAPTDAELHAHCAHPDWQYTLTEGPRKQWDDADTPPDETWERNVDMGDRGWERFDYTEESYWRRRKPAAARQATGQADTEPDPTTADDPTPLRWGYGNVLHGDDDSITVCLSGPDREPYWLELDPERAAALRDDLTPPAVNPACMNCNGGATSVGRCTVMFQGGGRCEKRADHRPPGSDDPLTPAPAVGRPAVAPDTDARPPRTAWRTESIETDGFETTWTVEDEPVTCPACKRALAKENR